MPAYGVVQTSSGHTMQALQPLVQINGSTCDYVFCSAIEDAGGIVPSRAIIQYGSNTTHTTAPNTLNKKSWPWTRGSNVKIYAGNSLSNDILFRGMLVRRLDQGETDMVQWEAWDYRHLLNFIPVRGCLVWDPSEQVVKFISRYVHRWNPDGKWNCYAANMTVGGHTGLVPVFSSVSDIGMTYQSPDQVFPAELVPNEITAWTPRRALTYLWALANISEASVPGCKSPEWRSLSNSHNLGWDSGSLNISAKDLTQAYDPLDRKLADISCQGETLGHAIDKVLKSTGTHGLGVEHLEDKSYLFFYPKQIAQPDNDTQERAVINLCRGGTVSDSNTAYDFEVHDDITTLAESVLAEGSIIHVESKLIYDPDAPTECTIQKEWSVEEQGAFLTGIQGAEGGDGHRYALYPETIGDTDTSKFLLADGGGDRPLAALGTDGNAAAIKLLRACFPRVFRCFSINSEVAYDEGILKGLDDVYAGTDTYPYLKIPRGVLLEQAQFFIEQGHRLLDKLPLRIQVNAEQTVGLHDATTANGIHIDPYGRIWINGLVENIDGDGDCLYNKALASIDDESDLSEWHCQKFIINARIPLDHRVQGYGFLDGKDRALDAALARELEGPLMMYIDAPDSWVEEHQVNSYPGPSAKYFQDDDVTGLPLNRYLPPGSEQTHAQFAAQRRLATVGAPRKTSSWHMNGIRPEYKAGLWIEKVKMVGGTGSDTDYDIGAPIEQVTYDFMNQRTLVGGLISNLARLNDKSANPAAPAANGAGKKEEKPPVIEDEEIDLERNRYRNG